MESISFLKQTFHEKSDRAKLFITPLNTCVRVCKRLVKDTLGDGADPTVLGHAGTCCLPCVVGSGLSSVPQAEKGLSCASPSWE